MMRSCWLAVLLLIAIPARAQESLPSVVVSADETLSEPLSRVVRDYARERQVAVALSFSGAEATGAQIAAGAPADVLITARQAHLDELKQQGLVDVYSETPIATDRLALVAPDGVKFPVALDHKFPTGRLLEAAGVQPLFVVGYPMLLPEGTPARDALRKYGAEADLEQYTVYLKDRGQMRAAIKTEHAFGLLLASDARLHGLNILGIVPDSDYPAITYHAVVLAGENMDEARHFIEFLKSEEAKETFEEYGFGTP